MSIRRGRQRNVRKIATGPVVAVGAVILAASVGSISCHRNALPEDAAPLFTPFNQRKPVAIVRAADGGGTVTLAIRSLMQGRLAIEFDEITLHPGDGTRPLVVALPAACVLAGGRRAVLAVVPRLSGLPTSASEGSSLGALRVSIKATTVPLNDPGRSMYREWAWLRRPTEIAMIDAELANMDALPECTASTD